MLEELALEDRVVGARLRAVAERLPDAPFLAFPSKSFSYGAFAELTNRVANSFVELGLGKFGKLAIFVRNSPEFVESWFAAARIGAIYVPINTEYRGEVLRYQLDNAEVTHLVIAPEFVDRISPMIERLPMLKHVILTQPAELPVEITSRANVHLLEHLYSGSMADPGIDVDYAHPHAISFTSGTTGLSKGVLCVNAHVITFASDWARYMAFQPHEAIYTPLPLFHAIGAWLGVVPAMLGGARITIGQRFSATSYWDEVRAAEADIAHGIFSMIPILLKQPERSDDASQPARAFYIGNHNPTFEERFKCHIVEVYGSTETGIVTATNYGQTRVPRSCGKANSETFEVEIVDAQDRPTQADEVGEIVVRPRKPFSMLHSYYRQETASIEAFRNLWFHTGDNGRRDNDGNIFFVDRKKDAIRRRGENISSYELESAINAHPDILECAAIAVQSDLGEDEVKMVVVLKPGAEMSAEDFWRFCETSLPRFWIPSILEVRGQMPKTATNKIQKYLLKEIGKEGSVYSREWRSGAIRKL